MLFEIDSRVVLTVVTRGLCRCLVLEPENSHIDALTLLIFLLGKDLGLVACVISLFT